jgi:hypothetical protein
LPEAKEAVLRAAFAADLLAFLEGRVADLPVFPEGWAVALPASQAAEVSPAARLPAFRAADGHPVVAPWV